MNDNRFFVNFPFNATPVPSNNGGIITPERLNEMDNSLVPKKVRVITENSTKVINPNGNKEAVTKTINENPVYTATFNDNNEKVVEWKESHYDDSNQYSGIKDALLSNAIEVDCAANLITAQIAHNVIHSAYGENSARFMQDCYDELNDHLFNTIKNIVLMHLKAFMRYETMKIKKRVYFSTKTLISDMVTLANEYYGYMFNKDDIISEIEKIYETFK